MSTAKGSNVRLDVFLTSLRRSSGVPLLTLWRPAIFTRRMWDNENWYPFDVGFGFHGFHYLCMAGIDNLHY